MFCKQCGAKLDEDAQFCKQCGTATKHNGDSEAINTQEQNASPAAINEGEQPQAKSIEKKPKKGLFIGFAAMLAVIVAAIALIGIFGGDSDNELGNIYSECNFNNGGKFAYDDTHLYFVGHYDEDDEDTVVYSTDYDGGNKTLISDNGDIFSIRICDGRIYYRASGDEVTIGVMDTDGSSDTTIVKADEDLSRYNVYRDKLYYKLDDEIHACNLNGEEDTVILEEVKTFTLCNGVIYFTRHDDDIDTISSYRIKNGETKELCKSSRAINLTVNEDTLYFVCDTGLSSVSISEDTGVTEVIRDDHMYYGVYIFYNDCIYYNHQLPDDDIELMAEAFSEDDIEAIVYKIALTGIGSIYKTPISGGDGESVDSDQSYVYSLYSCPKDLYCIRTALSDAVSPVELY